MKIECRRKAVAFDTLGCKLNQAETESLARQFAAAGYRLVASADEADVYILNTCTVTHIADRKSRHWLRLARRRHPGALVVVTGCYAERAGGELARIGGVDLVVGNQQKPHLVKIVADCGPNSPVSVQELPAASDQAGLRTRSFIRVQDGCNSYCAYCIVPLVRSAEKSLPAAEVVAEVRQRVNDGCQEVVLTGTEVGSYKHDGVGLTDLLWRVLAETGVSRLRLSSLQPQEISPGLIELWRDARLCRHFHLALQSGSDRVLKRMKRRYATADYQRSVSLIRNTLPEAAITTDVIVGFPGETDAEFEQSYRFCQQMEFARLHVFPYSPRRGTEAALMPQPVTAKIKRLRSQRLLALADETARNFRLKFLGKTMRVLWEKQAGGIWSGLTDNYIRVYARSDEDLTNQLRPVKLVAVWRDGLWGVN